MSLLPGKLRAEHQRERWDHDWYVEPRWCNAVLFTTVRFKGPIHDPFCGEGRIVEAARAAGYEATGSDIVDRGFGETGVNFLTDMRPRVTLIFNPPGKPKGEPNWRDLSIAHALEVAIATVAVIVPIPTLAGQDHYSDFFKPYPPQLVLICARRPSMPPGGTDIPAKGGTTDYCWIIWRRNKAGEWARRASGTVIEWLPP